MYFFDGGNKSVSAARQGFNVSRFLGRISQDLANAPNGVVEAVVEVYKCVGGPDVAPEFFTSYQVPGGLHQDAKDLQGLPLKAQFYAAFAQFAGTQINAIRIPSILH